MMVSCFHYKIQMSNKHLKVYQIQFVTELRKLHFNVKFPCSLKVTWKRSNESAQSTLVPLQNGVVNFNQTLRLSVNMYFDTNTNKFVEKKCLYSFLISTQKGEKSAGTVTLDLADFFNKRVYQIDQAFTLEKCPVAGTKVQMKISYEEDTKQKGYDSMSCISATNQLDSSVASVDLSELAASRSNISEKQEESETQKSSKSDRTNSERQVKPKEEYFQKLDQSDVIEYPISNTNRKDSNNTKIGENIKSINDITSKINQFVNDKTKSIKYEVEGLRRRVTQLEEEAQGERITKEKIQRLLEEEKKKNNSLNKEFSDFKAESQHAFEEEHRNKLEIEAKSAEIQKLITQMESKMNQSGEAQGQYLQQLKHNAKATEEKLNAEVKELRQALTSQKKLKNEQNLKINQLESSLKQTKQYLQSQSSRCSSLQQTMQRKQQQLEQTRINLQKAYQNLLKSLSSIIS